MAVVALIARILFSLALFLLGYDNVTNARTKAEYAAQKGLVGARILVPLAGLILSAGCLSIALGFYAQIGALFVLAFLLPVTFVMHAFWKYDDPDARRSQRVHFYKNLALIGGALLILAFGSGEMSMTHSAIWPAA